MPNVRALHPFMQTPQLETIKFGAGTKAEHQEEQPQEEEYVDKEQDQELTLL